MLNSVGAETVTELGALSSISAPVPVRAACAMSARFLRTTAARFQLLREAVFEAEPPNATYQVWMLRQLDAFDTGM